MKVIDEDKMQDKVLIAERDPDAINGLDLLTAKNKLPVVNV